MFGGELVVLRHTDVEFGELLVDARKRRAILVEQGVVLADDLAGPAGALGRFVVGLEFLQFARIGALLFEQRLYAVCLFQPVFGQLSFLRLEFRHLGAQLGGRDVRLIDAGAFDGGDAVAQVDELILDAVEVGRLAHDVGAEFGGGEVEQAQRYARQALVVEGAAEFGRQLSHGLQRVVGDDDAVHVFIHATHAAQDAQDLIGVGFFQIDRGEEFAEARMLFDDLGLLAVVRCDDALRAATMKHRHQAAQHAVRALGLKAVQEVCEIVDDEDAVLRIFEVVDDAQEVLVDLRRIVAGEEAFGIQAKEAALDDVLRDVRLAAAFFDAVDECGFADAGRARQHDVAAVAQRQDFADLPDLGVAADQREVRVEILVEFEQVGQYPTGRAFGRFVGNRVHLSFRTGRRCPSSALTRPGVPP